MKINTKLDLLRAEITVWAEKIQRGVDQDVSGTETSYAMLCLGTCPHRVMSCVIYRGCCARHLECPTHLVYGSNSCSHCLNKLQSTCLSSHLYLSQQLSPELTSALLLE